MNKEFARKADKLLHILIESKQKAWTVKHIKNLAIRSGMTAEEAEIFTYMFTVDGFLDHVRHPNMPEHDFGIYNLSEKALKFVRIDGGYTEQQKMKGYEKANVRFTWIRHWIWFYTSIFSLLLNMYFIWSRFLIG